MFGRRTHSPAWRRFKTLRARCCIMDGDAVRYMALGTEPDTRLRVMAIGTVFLDTITTLYLLYLSGLPVREFNPLGGTDV